MKNGLIYSIAFALLALILATMNFIQAFIAAMTIGLIIINVVAIIAYLNWELGASESVAVVTCVGFAVDYVVHLASHYIHSKHKDRHSRIREALRELGISILSGSVTTILATCVLFICVLRVAILLVSNALNSGFSVLFSQLATLTMLSVFGFQALQWGKIGLFPMVLFKTCRNFFVLLFYFCFLLCDRIRQRNSSWHAYAKALWGC